MPHTSKTRQIYTQFPTPFYSSYIFTTHPSKQPCTQIINMGKKMKLPFLFKTTQKSIIKWPTCIQNPRTLSFRDTNLSDMSNNDDDPAKITRLDSDRLFFEPGESSSIVEEAKETDIIITENNNSIINAWVVEVGSRDPVLDYRVSMEEMVQAYGLREWGSFEELLACYFEVNDWSNHGYIIEAFVDCLVTHFGNYLVLDDDINVIEKDSSSSSSSSSSYESSSSDSSPKVSSSSV